MRKMFMVTVSMLGLMGSAFATSPSNNNGPTNNNTTNNYNTTNQGGQGGRGGDGGTGIGFGGNASAGAAASATAVSGAAAINRTSVRSSNYNRNTARGGNAAVNIGGAPAYTHQSMSGGYSVRTTGVAYAPALAPAGVESCMASVSGGGGWMGGALSLGFPVMDKGCDARLFSRTMANLGLRTAAVQMLCHDERAAAALATQGIFCSIRDSDNGVNLFAGLMGASSAPRSRQVQVTPASYVPAAAPIAPRVPATSVNPSYRWDAFRGYVPN
jgi:hypothetical protein